MSPKSTAREERNYSNQPANYSWRNCQDTVISFHSAQQIVAEHFAFRKVCARRWVPQTLYVQRTLRRNSSGNSSGSFRTPSLQSQIVALCFSCVRSYEKWTSEWSYTAQMKNWKISRFGRKQDGSFSHKAYPCSFKNTNNVETLLVIMSKDSKTRVHFDK